MADQVAINVRVIDSEVGPKLRAVRDQIKGAFADAERSAKGLGQTNAAVLKSFEAIKLSALGSLTGRARLGAELGESETGARKLVESLHGLSPVLDSIGLGLANTRGFAAAARFGLVGFAAVAGGAVVAGLEKASDHIDQVKKNVADLGGSAADFETLRKGARDLGLDVGTLADAHERWAKARANAGGASFVKGIGYEVTLAKALQVGTGDIESGSKDLQIITEGLEKNKGRLTPDIAEKIQAGSAIQIAKLFGLGEVPKGSPLTPQKFLAGRLGPEGRSLNELQLRLSQDSQRIDKEFAAKSVDLSDSVSRLKTSFTSALPPTTALGGALDRLARKMNAAADARAAKLPEYGPPAPRRDTTGAFRRAIDAAAPEGPASIKQESTPSVGQQPDGKKQVALTGTDPKGYPGGSAEHPSNENVQLDEELKRATRSIPEIKKATGDQLEAIKKVFYDTTPYSPERGAAPFPPASKVPGFAKVSDEQPYGRAVSIDANPTAVALQAIKEILHPPWRRPPEPHGPDDGFFRGGSIGLRGFAGGGSVDPSGVIHGPGTGTSDSILALVDGRRVIRLSNGEGVVNRRAMLRIGSHGLDQLNSYADGAPVGPFVSPAHAASASGKTVNINLTLGDNTYPVTAHESVGERLVQEANAWLMASGGRRQSSIS